VNCASIVTPRSFIGASAGIAVGAAAERMTIDSSR
jgi:hypothetical protein